MHSGPKSQCWALAIGVLSVGLVGATSALGVELERTGALTVQGGAEGGWPYAIPSRDSCVVSLDEGAALRDDYGLRLTVACEDETLYTSHGLMDTEFVEPEFFVGAGHVVMLANVGAEDSWGLLALDLSEDSPRALGTIEVARPAEPGGLFLRSALPLVSLHLVEGTYLAVFESDLVLAPGTESQEPLEAASGSIILAWNAGTWALREDG